MRHVAAPILRQALGGVVWALLCSPAWALPLTLVSDHDAEDHITIGVFLQPDLSVRLAEDSEATSRLRVRNARLDLRGAVFASRASYRLHFNFAPGGPELFDAWIAGRFGDGWSIRAGRDLVPHHAQWETNPATQVFPERSQLVRTWGVPSGRDAGLSLRHEGTRHAFAAGVYQGSTGASHQTLGHHLYAARMTLALIGPHTLTEYPTQAATTPSVVLGVALLTALDNTWVDHSLGLTSTPAAGDVYRAVLDLRIRCAGLSLYLEAAAAHTRFQEDDAQDAARTGLAAGVSAAWLVPALPPSVLALRWGTLDHDLARQEAAMRGHEWGASWTRLHKGTHWLSRLSYLGEFNAGAAAASPVAVRRTTHTVMLDHILQY